MKTKTNNYCAKYSRQFNKAVVMVDRKKDSKRGKVKHKSKGLGDY